MDLSWLTQLSQSSAPLLFVVLIALLARGDLLWAHQVKQSRAELERRHNELIAAKDHAHIVVIKQLTERLEEQRRLTGEWQNYAIKGTILAGEAVRAVRRTSRSDIPGGPDEDQP